jgi:hypothetical protein
MILGWITVFCRLRSLVIQNNVINISTATFKARNIRILGTQCTLTGITLMSNKGSFDQKCSGWYFWLVLGKEFKIVLQRILGIIEVRLANYCVIFLG